MAHRHLPALLGMPASLRPLLFETQSTPCLSRSQRCALHATGRTYARSLKHAVSVGAFHIPHSPNLPLSDIPISQLLESPDPDGSLSGELTALFTKNPATFYHGTSDFYTLKKNTRIPEVCILGRSNVGKSTFVNALANRRDNELAYTSAKAGKTRAMNAFGFGPAPLMKDLADTDTKTKRTEDLPKHRLFVVDMPGYGHKSLTGWGKAINLYLNKRQAVKGAVLLIDGEVGPKSGDLVAMEILQEAGVRTAIVLTKADKARNEQALRDTCKEVWMAMRDINNRNPNSKWEWETDFFITALGATRKEIGADTVSVARLVVARLAGLVQEKERPEQGASKGYSGKIISFDDIQFAPSKTPQPPAGTPASGIKPASPPATDAPSSGFAALEQAATEQHKARTAFTRPPQPSTIGANPRRRARMLNPRRTQLRALHTTVPRLKTEPRPQRKSESEIRPPLEKPPREPLSPELRDTLQSFISNLEAKSMPNRSKTKTPTPAQPTSKWVDEPIWDPAFVAHPTVKKRREKTRKEAKPEHVQIYLERLQHEKHLADLETARAQQQEMERQARRTSGSQPKQSRGTKQENEEPEEWDGRHNDEGGLEEQSSEDIWEQMESFQSRGKKARKKEKMKRTKRFVRGEAEAKEKDEDEFAHKFKGAL